MSDPLRETARLGKHQDSRENKTNRFPEGPDFRCFVIFLDFRFNRNKRITGTNQDSRLGTYNNKFNSQNHWMNDLQSTFLILSASFSSTSCCFSPGITLKIVAFLLEASCLCCCVHSRKRKLAVLVFPASCHSTFHHALISCCNVSRAGCIASCITIGIHLI